MDGWSATQNHIRSKILLNMSSAVPDIRNPPLAASTDLDTRVLEAIGIKKQVVRRHFFELQRQIQSYLRIPTVGDLVWDEFNRWRVVTDMRMDGTSEKNAGKEIGVILTDNDGRQTIVPIFKLVFQKVQKNGHVWVIRSDGYLESFGSYMKWLLPYAGYVTHFFALTSVTLISWGKRAALFLKLYDGRAGLKPAVNIPGRMAEIALGQSRSLMNRSTRDVLIQGAIMGAVAVSEMGVGLIMSLLWDNTIDARLTTDVATEQRYYVGADGEGINLTDSSSVAASAERTVIAGATLLGKVLYKSGEKLVGGANQFLGWGSDKLAAGTQALKNIFYGALAVGALIIITKFK